MRRVGAAGIIVLVGLAVVVLGITGVLTGLVGPVPPAAAHTKLIGSEPAAGAVLATPPVAVTLHLGAKPATLEGDPLQVLAPDGSRVDSGRPQSSGDGTVVTMRLRGGPLDAGGYHVLYRIVSGDSHLITGRLDFWVSGAGWPDGPAPAPPPLTRVGLGGQQRFLLVGAGAAALLALVTPRRRRHGARHA
jgi:methionine-rich copper-binding protein CopC